MLWAFVIVAATGLTLGFWFRVPAVLAASIAVIALSLGSSPLAGYSFLSAAISALALLAVLQGSYLAGLVIAIGCGRVKLEKERTTARHALNGTVRSGSGSSSSALL